MWLRLGGVYSTGLDLLDQGISDTELVSTANGVFLVTTTGTYGGLAAYRIASDGTLTQTGSFIFPDTLDRRTSFDLAQAEINGETLLFVGANSTQLTGVRLNADGSFGPVRHFSFAQMEAAHLDGAPGALASLTQMTDTPTTLLPDGGWNDKTVAVHHLTLGGQTYALTLGAMNEQVISYRQMPNGDWLEVSTIGMENGLGLATPSAMELTSIQGQDYLLVASSGGSSLSVIAVDMGGMLRPTHHIMDTGTTRFANVQDLSVVEHGDHVFVFAVGADHGVSMFRLLPSGQLLHMESWGDGQGGGLNAPVTVSTYASDTLLHVMIGAQNSTGLSHFTVDLTNMGVVQTGAGTGAEMIVGGNGNDVLVAASDNDTLMGGVGHDMLVSGPGRSTLTGGAWADIFVIRAESTDVTITDFWAGRDQLDLTDLPMLRSTLQLSITPTETGAVLSYRNVTVTIHSHDGTPLTAESLFPMGLQGPDSLFLIFEEIPPLPPRPDRPSYPEPPAPIVPVAPPPPLPEEVSGQFLIGRARREDMSGGPGDDFIYGGNNHDVIRGVAGNNTLHGGYGHDTIFGGVDDDLIVGGPGNDRLWGMDGNDTIFGVAGNNRFGGGAGDDLLIGGTGRDTIYGGLGNDTIYGNAGNNSLWGMRGDDLIHGGDGNDRIGGGRGNDTIYGHGGNDTIYGGLGDDLLYGGAGDDELWGMDGNDTIFGGTGNDFIHGGRGDDVLDGGPGDDTMVGGPGADTFIFDEGHELLLIRDFTFDQDDRLQLDHNLWGGGLSAEQVVHAYGQVTDGQLILDFGGGDIITLAGITDMARMAEHIDIV